MKTQFKLTKEVVLEIRQRWKDGEKLASIAASYPYTPAYIWNIATGKAPKKLFYNNEHTNTQ